MNRGEHRDLEARLTPPVCPSTSRTGQQQRLTARSLWAQGTGTMAGRSTRAPRPRGTLTTRRTPPPNTKSGRRGRLSRARRQCHRRIRRRGHQRSPRARASRALGQCHRRIQRRCASSRNRPGAGPRMRADNVIGGYSVEATGAHPRAGPRERSPNVIGGYSVEAIGAHSGCGPPRALGQCHRRIQRRGHRRSLRAWVPASARPMSSADTASRPSALTQGVGPRERPADVIGGYGGAKQ
jgi:hypothetical protein